MEEVGGSGQLSIVQSFARGEKYSHSSRRWAEVRDGVTYSIGKDMMPMYALGREGGLPVPGYH